MNRAMVHLRMFIRRHGRRIAWALVAAVGLGVLLLYKLGSLTPGLSPGEVAAAIMPVGWHGIYHQPLYLPLKLLRSVDFALFQDHGKFLTRLPNVFLGGLTIISFVWLIRLWHGLRIALFAGALFAASAWVLHVSRLASFDVLYLWALPTLLLVDVLLQKYSERAYVWYPSILIWGVMLYIPGMVWLLILNFFLQREYVARGWQHFGRWWQRTLYVLGGIVWLPLLVRAVVKTHSLGNWLGLPAHIATPFNLAKQFIAVPVHLFIRGPQYPQLWLGRAPLLDIFSLVACLIGIYFYATHWRAARSRLLGLLAIAGIILVSLGGPVSLSLLVPLLYIALAAGLTYLLREWLAVFPHNPLARGLGIGLLVLVVGLSCMYNLRAYFVAWPHNHTTQATFQYRR
jgi:hypothetical protein